MALRVKSIEKEINITVTQSGNSKVVKAIAEPIYEENQVLTVNGKVLTVNNKVITL